MRCVWVSVAFALIAPTVCCALGAESEEFVGVSNDGRLTVLRYISDGGEWTGHNAVYGSSRKDQFQYCWVNEGPVDPTDPASPRESTHFVCTKAHGGKPSVLYRHGNYDRRHASGERYKEAMAWYKKARHSRGELSEYYICEKGCSDDMPLIMFEIGFDST
jgi:hypothetical protein